MTRRVPGGLGPITGGPSPSGVGGGGLTVSAPTARWASAPVMAAMEDLERCAGQHTGQGVDGFRGDRHVNRRAKNQHVPGEQSPEERNGRRCAKPVHVTEPFVTAITLATVKEAERPFDAATPRGRPPHGALLCVVESVRDLGQGLVDAVEIPHAPEGESTDTQCDELITHMPHSGPNLKLPQDAGVSLRSEQKTP